MKKFLISTILLFDISIAQVIKDGGYGLLGSGIGYDKHSFMVNNITNTYYSMVINANFGYVFSGIKTEIDITSSYGLGGYRGLYTFNTDSSKNGTTISAISTNGIWHPKFITGYDLLSSTDSNLYIQIGAGYRFFLYGIGNSYRAQGYLYIPIELEGSNKLNNNRYIEYKVGYNFLLSGNHRNLTTRIGFNNDLIVNQRKGFGISSMIGYGVNHDNSSKGFRVIYNYWNISDSSSAMLNTSNAFSAPYYKPQNGSYYEPKNSTHEIYLMFIDNF